MKQPSVNFNGGKGWIGEKGRLVENDSKLRFAGLTNQKYINQFKNIQNQGFFGKGTYAVDTESILRDSQITKLDRPVMFFLVLLLYHILSLQWIQKLEMKFKMLKILSLKILWNLG